MEEIIDGNYSNRIVNYNKIFSSKEIPFWIYSEVIDKFMTMLGNIDKYTKYHCYRVAILSKMFLESIDKEANEELQRLDLNEIKEIVYGAYVHDIGKAQVPSYIIKDKKNLNEEEWAELKAHSANGAFLFLGPGYEHIRSVILCHHERFDGEGYPMNYRGKDIPLGGRIVCLMDSFDAMTDKRPYQDNKPLNLAEAELEILNCSSKQFDPDLLEPFYKMLESDEFLHYWENKSDNEYLKKVAMETKNWIFNNTNFEEKLNNDEKNIKVLKKILNYK